MYNYLQQNTLPFQQLIENRTLGKATTLIKFKKRYPTVGLVYSIHTHQGFKIYG